MRSLFDNETVEWDCLHESGGTKDDDDDDSEGEEEDESMEDMTEEAKEEVEGT